MGRDTNRDMKIGLAGILAGALLTVSAYDTMMSRTADAAGMTVGDQVSEMLGVTVDLPCFAENRVVSIVLKVLDDVTGEEKSSGEDS